MNILRFQQPVEKRRYWLRSLATLCLVGFLLSSFSSSAFAQSPAQGHGRRTKHIPPDGTQSQLMINPSDVLPQSTNLLQDPSFESYTPNPVWLESSVNFGTPLCTAADCGDGAGTAAPRTGMVWAWFGGTTENETASLSQSVTIPNGSALLQFYLWIGTADAGSDTADAFTAKIDGTTVFSANATQSASYPTYTFVSVDVSSYANGAVHTVAFSSVTTGQIVNFNLDDVALTIPGSIPPGAFAKTNPPNGATGQSTSLQLFWEASSGATSYEYCYDNTNDNACPLWVSTAATSANLAGLNPNTTYYWQVLAKNASGTTYANGDSTAYWAFTTASATTDILWSGTTDRGYPMSFKVNEAATLWADFKLKTDFTAPNCYNASGTIEINVPGPQNITMMPFGYSSSTFSFTGVFTSPTTTMGDYHFTNYLIVVGIPSPPYVCNYYLTQSGTWNATVPAYVDVSIGSNPQGSYQIPVANSIRQNYAGVDNGPVKVQSTNHVPIVAALRDLWWNGSAYTSSIQLMGLPESQLSDTYVFPSYNNVSLNDQLRFGNVGNISTTVTVTIGGVVRGTYDLQPNQRQKVNYAGLDSGPVIVHSSNGVPIIASIRDAWINNGVTSSFSQLMGLPQSQLSDTYIFPSYNNVSLSDQIRFGNVGNAPTTVTVTIGGQLMGSYYLLPNQRDKASYPGLDSGPVIVHSSNGVPIIASLREAWLNNGVTTSYFQMMGLPQSQLSDKYVFPVYDNVSLSGQLRFGNVGNAPTTVTVTIAGVQKGTYPLDPNQRQKVSYVGLDDGPIVVQSSNGVPIIAALRDAWLVSGVTTSFSQLMGLPGSQLSTVYLFPSYNNITYDNQLRIGVP